MTAMISSAGPVQRSGKNLSLEIVDARRSFDKVQALDGLSIALAPGEFVALLGPSGCGKTTALRAVAGLEQLDSGAVLVGGSDVTHLPPHRRQLGMVFQAYSLFPNMNALDNVAFGLEVRKVPVAKRRARAGELLELVGLAGMGRALRPRAVRGPAAAGRAGQGVMRRAGPAAPRRAALGARRQGARPAARRDPPHPDRARHHDAVRDPRPGRSPVDVRPGRRDAQRAARAARSAGRGVLAAGYRLRRPVRRLGEPAARRGCGDRAGWT